MCVCACATLRLWDRVREHMVAATDLNHDLNYHLLSGLGLVKNLIQFEELVVGLGLGLGGLGLGWLGLGFGRVEQINTPGTLP